MDGGMDDLHCGCTVTQILQARRDLFRKNAVNPISELGEIIKGLEDFVEPHQVEYMVSAYRFEALIARLKQFRDEEDY